MPQTTSFFVSLSAKAAAFDSTVSSKSARRTAPTGSPCPNTATIQQVPRPAFLSAQARRHSAANHQAISDGPSRAS